VDSVLNVGFPFLFSPSFATSLELPSVARRIAEGGSELGPGRATSCRVATASKHDTNRPHGAHHPTVACVLSPRFSNAFPSLFRRFSRHVDDSLSLLARRQLNFCTTPVCVCVCLGGWACLSKRLGGTASRFMP